MERPLHPRRVPRGHARATPFHRRQYTVLWNSKFGEACAQNACLAIVCRCRTPKGRDVQQGEWLKSGGTSGKRKKFEHHYVL